MVLRWRIRSHQFTGAGGRADDRQGCRLSANQLSVSSPAAQILHPTLHWRVPIHVYEIGYLRTCICARCAPMLQAAR
eukprot:6194218-Pleurochrysis_carterae.AAC.4